jgi:diguanylate cyclase (GGDEF)-like protein/PAS domain S-box-containing protein
MPFTALPGKPRGSLVFHGCFTRIVIGVLKSSTPTIGGHTRIGAGMGGKRKQPRRQAPATPIETESHLFRMALDAAPCAMVVVDQGGAIKLVNRAAERMFGYRHDELLDRPVETLVPVGVQGSHARQRDAFLTAPAPRQMGTRRDLDARRRDGSTFPVEVGLNPVRIDGRWVVVGAIIDLSERKRAEERMAEQSEQLARQNAKLAELAVTDGLTGLRNRRAFIEQLLVQLELAVRHARSLSVLILDVDYFKAYNDEFGHLAGDDILRQVARILGEVARRSDFVARIGGEEFGIILPETDRDGAVVLGERFRAAVEESAWPNRVIKASLGATTIDFSHPVPRPNAPGVSQILTEADRALYYSKQTGRNRVTHLDDMEPSD